jgi:hypothetical protein
MSELSNPLFDNEREFLERQKEEYKNALIGDVDHIKTQSQEIGKKAAIAGGVFLAGYLVKRLFSSDEKKKDKKLKKSKKKGSKHSIPVTTELADYDPYVHEQTETNNLSDDYISPAAQDVKEKNKSNSLLNSNVTKVISSQVVALLMMYITKKVEEHLNSVSKNNDIATEPVAVPPTETTDYRVPIEDAI